MSVVESVSYVFLKLVLGRKGREVLWKEKYSTYESLIQYSRKTLDLFFVHLHFRFHNLVKFKVTFNANDTFIFILLQGYNFHMYEENLKLFCLVLQKLNFITLTLKILLHNKPA